MIGDEVTDLLHLQYEYRVLVPYVPSTVVDTVNLSQIEVRGATVSFFFHGQNPESTQTQKI